MTLTFTGKVEHLRAEWRVAASRIPHEERDEHRVAKDTLGNVLIIEVRILKLFRDANGGYACVIRPNGRLSDCDIEELTIVED